MELLGDVDLVESRFGSFGDSVNLSTVCTKRTIASKTILDAPDGTPCNTPGVWSAFVHVHCIT
jgi:hypothetical protein